MVDVNELIGMGEGGEGTDGNPEGRYYTPGEGDDDDSMDGMIELPVEVKRRIFALKKIQLEVISREVEFFKEMHALEKKYLTIYQPLFDKRALITAGRYEPTDEECDYPGIEELPKQMEAISINAMEKESGDNKEAEVPKEKLTGVPDFWLKIFENVDAISELIEDHDVEILKHLIDVKVETTDNPMGFKLNFYFTENEWFSNPILTKTYIMKCHIEPDDPFSFEGPEIIKSIGCTIDWKKGKNVTVKVVKKKQKHKQRGSIRTVSKAVTCPSFFNYFTPPEVPEGSAEELDEETQVKLSSDFEIGQYFREQLIPRAVLYYTGEALDDGDEEFEEEDDDDDDDESFDGGEEEADDERYEERGRGRRQEPEEDGDEEAGVGAGGRGAHKKRRNSNNKKDKKANPEECKNQ